MPRITNHLAGALLVFLTGCATSQDSSVASSAPPSPPASLPAPQTAPVDAADTVQVPSSMVQPAAARKKVQRGRASWYAHRFHGRRTANGERYNRHALTAAHPTLPIPSSARVRKPANGREVVVRINDRGPFHRKHAIDLSHAAAVMLGIVRGPNMVEIEQLTDVERRGSHWPQERAELPAKPLLMLSARNDRAL